MSTVANWKGIVFYALIGIIVGVAILYFIYTPTRNMINGVFASVSGSVGKLDLGGVVSWVTSHTDAVIASAMGLFGLLTLGLKLRKTGQILDQKVDELAEQTIESSGLKTVNEQLIGRISEMQTKIDSLESDPYRTEAQKIISDKQKQIDMLTGRLQELSQNVLPTAEERAAETKRIIEETLRIK